MNGNQSPKVGFRLGEKLTQPILQSPVTLSVARELALHGRFTEMLDVCRQIIESPGESPTMVLEVGQLLHSFGYLTLAKKCFEQAYAQAPGDMGALVNLANLANDAGDHAESRRWYGILLERLPDDPIIRRNVLTVMEYDPSATGAERLAHAKAWGRWAIARAGGERPRPLLDPVGNRPLRVGYVSADFCQHTVGLFVKDVLKAHDPARVRVFAYSAGRVRDWVTDFIQGVCHFRDVASVSDHDLAAMIRTDGIDVLIDLSGHTAGSRLTVFAHRPAPVQVSWLGYFSTTGLPCMDAVLQDEWHAPSGAEEWFSEPLIRLSGGRLVYTPVPWAPVESARPSLRRGYITFGCCNNSAKLNEQVLQLWSSILKQVPESRIVLKWRTFNDPELRRKITSLFTAHGVEPARVDLRGPSFHVDLLKEYADIDIALDPFPFTGGLTSCEALWMGVPVVTWPQSRAVSRQTYAYLSAIGLPELAARDADDYVRVAVELANDSERLSALSIGLRQRMQASSLMDVTGFTRQLEHGLVNLYQRIYQQQEGKPMGNQKILLNVGAGHPKSGALIPPVFRSAAWKEVRLDVDPVNQPDILGTMLDMSAVGSNSVDVIYSSHNIEHLYPNEIPAALQEFLRVLKPEGYVVITCPDLQAAAQMIAEDKLMDVAYNSPAGAVTPFDMVYSHRMFTGRDKPFMAHHCGFTLKVLAATLQSNGFITVAGKRRPAAFDLWVVASKSTMSEESIRELADRILPD